MEKIKKIITELLGYEDDTAGGIMTTEYIALKKRFNCITSITKTKKRNCFP